MIQNHLATIIICFILLSRVSLIAQSNDDSKLIMRAEVLFENCNYIEAIKVYQRSFEKKESGVALKGLVKSHFELANQYQFNGDGNNAQKHFGTALKYANQLVDLEKNNTDYRLLRGLMYQYNQQFENAKSDYEYVRLLDPKSGRVYYYLWTMESEEGIDKIEHSYVSQALELEPDLYEFHQELGSWYNSIGQTEEAIAKYERALEISPKNYKANFSLGQVYWALGDLVKMRYHFTESLKYFPDFGYAEMSLAGVELMEGNITEAIPLIKSALEDNPMTQGYLDMYIQNFPELSNYNFKRQDEIEDSPIDTNGYPRHYEDAIALAQVFKFSEAIDTFHQCYDSYSNYEGKQPTWETSILAWLTHCYQEVGDYAKGAQTAKKSLRLAVEHNLIVDQASIAANLSIIYYNWGDYKNAIQYARMSIQFLQTNNQEDKLYDAFTNIGNYYREWGVTDSAIYYDEKALVEANATGDLFKISLAKKELALSYSANNNVKKALEFIDDLKKIRKKLPEESQDAAFDLGTAQVYYESGDYSRALEHIEVAFEYYYNLQEIAPEHPNIIPFLETYIGILTHTDNTGLAYDNFLSMNDILFILTRKFFPAMNENGKLNYYRQIKERFESFNSFVINETNRPRWVFEKMYENQLLIKGLLFNNAQKNQNMIINSSDPLLQQQYKFLIENKNQLARSVTLTAEEKEARGLDIEGVQNEIDSLEVTLSQSGLLVHGENVYEEDLVNKVKGQLESNEAAVEIVRYRTYDFANGGAFTDQVNYLALILRGDRDSVDYVLLPHANALETKNYQAYVNSILYEVEDTQSYHAYWSPIQDKLKGIDKVYFAGDGVYHKININTLYDIKRKNYVIDQLDIRLVTSTRDIIQESPILPKRGRISLVGFPSFELGVGNNLGNDVDEISETVGTRAFTSIEYLEPLPGTFSEIKTIEEIFEDTKWETEVYTGRSALEENIKAIKDPTVLHIATHGYFEETQPLDNPLLYSGLFLSGASSNYKQGITEGEDGILTAYEAMNLDLTNTHMVVLSACETGMGHIENGDGVYGLQRAFLIAGAQSVIMSMWKVDDQATMELMVNFYRNLASAKDKHTAFREAQLRLRKTHPNPKYWGAFNIAGK